ncbi:MAG: TlpA family protein disulfide reductase [Trueperaceae bacterium]|nr:TlpA family protein disulfide reductase [Trueperaceae bacterium]
MTRYRRRTAVLLTLLASVLLLGTSSAQHVGDPFPTFELFDQAGVLVTNDDLVGRSWMINVWASWCPPCRAELPLLERAALDLDGEGVGLLLLNAGERASVASAFLEREGLALRTLVDPDTRDSSVEETQELLHRVRARGLPTTYFVDADGVIRSVFVGELLPDVLAERLDESFGVSWRP